MIDRLPLHIGHWLWAIGCWLTVTAAASPDFDAAKTYRIVCQQYAAGCVADGASNGQQTPLYYLATASNAASARWTLTDAGGGNFYIRNAATGHYVTYDGVRQGTTRRYVNMTALPDGTRSMWTVAQQATGTYVVRSTAQPEQLWDVRAGSYVVGTYSNAASGQPNQLFSFYDEQGLQVRDVFTSQAPLRRALSSLTIGTSAPLFTTDQGGYYLCPTPLTDFGTDLSLTISYEPREGWGHLSIDGTEVASGSHYIFNKVAGGRTYRLSIAHSDGTQLSADITFTSLPVVSIQGDFGYDYLPGSIIVQEPAKPTYAPHDMKAKWRGGITNGADKHKRNYHVKFLDEAGEKQDQRFFDLRNDNSWLLEACQVDMMRIRNRIITDLWNDYSARPYYAELEPKALTGSRGRFVELILNEEYRGIYCMTEAIDRKQMKLKKYDEATQTMHGQLWKSKDWSYAVFMGHQPDNDFYPATPPAAANGNSESWDQYYVKYPDFDDVRPTDWQTLRDAVSFVCTSTDNDFRLMAGQFFDLPVLVDYYILLETTLATDNHGKNMYFAVYDKQQSPRITIGIWDLDASMGQRWSDAFYHSSIMQPEQDYTTYITRNEHGDYNLFRRLKATNAGDFTMRVRQRYRDLRQTHLCTDSILARFERQLAEFKTAGADQREYRKWSGDSDVAGRTLNFDTEMAYLRTWITKRMNYLDQTRFRIAELPSAIHTVDTATGDHPASHPVYTLSGRRMSPDSSPDALSRLPRGIYVVGGRKIVR